MPTPNFHFEEQRWDVNKGIEVETGGWLVQRLYLECPNCHTENLIAVWENYDARVSTGSLTCNKCEKPLWRPDPAPAQSTTVAEVKPVSATATPTKEAKL